MIGFRQQAGQLPLSLPILFITIISTIQLLEVTNGQPGYYFKAQGSSGRVLPRLGRRSDGDFPRGGGSEASGAMAGGGGILDNMWQMNSNNNPPLSSSSLPIGELYGGRSLIAPAAAATALNSQLDKAILWRRLFGDGNTNNYEESLLESLYRSKVK